MQSQVPEGLELAQPPEPREPPVKLLDIGSSAPLKIKNRKHPVPCLLENCAELLSKIKMNRGFMKGDTGTSELFLSEYLT